MYQHGRHTSLFFLTTNCSLIVTYSGYDGRGSNIMHYIARSKYPCCQSDKLLTAEFLAKFAPLLKDRNEEKHTPIDLASGEEIHRILKEAENDLGMAWFICVICVHLVIFVNDKSS